MNGLYERHFRDMHEDIDPVTLILDYREVEFVRHTLAGIVETLPPVDRVRLKKILKTIERAL